jgi:hypothetical protein
VVDKVEGMLGELRELGFATTAAAIAASRWRPYPLLLISIQLLVVRFLKKI